MLDELDNEYVTVRVLKQEYEDFYSVRLVCVCAKYFNFSKGVCLHWSETVRKN